MARGHFISGWIPVSISPAGNVTGALLGLLLAAQAARGEIVINEFHPKPEDDHDLEEFVELHNTGAAAVDVSGWRLANAVTFTIPAGTNISAGGYLVVAMNPAAITARFSVSAVGPWSGKLNSTGETIELRDAGGALRDSVGYKFGFPWPSMIDGEGASAELIHPGLDNSEGSAWRASGAPAGMGAYVPAAPTPGARNSIYKPLEQTPPAISQVSHQPLQPVSGQPVTVTATVQDPDGVGPVTLEYQVVEPGSYIRISDAAYATGWVPVTMTHQGGGVHSAVVPGTVQANRRLVRYRIVFEDTLGNRSRAPFADDAQPNFAWYVYDGLPEWKGALRPSTVIPANPTPLQTFSPATLSSVPVYTLITTGTDVLNSQYNTSFREVRMRGTMVVDGVVYENIEYRNRGQFSTYQSGKNKWRFYFNPGRDLAAKNHFGVPYAETWGGFSANANASPWVPVNRGSAGMEEAMSLKAHTLAGGLAPHTHYYHFRVVRNAVETPAAGTMVGDPVSTGGTIDGQYAGDFWGLYLAVEKVGGGFLDERGLPDGNIYKIELNEGDPETVLPGFPLDANDWKAFRDTSSKTIPTAAWWRANMDMESYYTFHSLNRLLGNIDLRPGENHLFYHRSTDNRWVPIPWDMDMMFIAKTHKPGTIDQHRAVVYHPELALEFRNRAREILDLLASDADPAGGQMGQLVDEYRQILAPPGTTDNWANADAAMWNLHPRTKGTVVTATGLGGTSGSENHRGNFFRSPLDSIHDGGTWTRWLRDPAFSGTAGFDDMAKYFLDYATDTWPGGNWAANNGRQQGYGYQYLLKESLDAAIPSRPVITYTGEPGHPVDALRFTSSAYAGTNAHAETQWRISRISAPGVAGYTAAEGRKYEVTPSWTAAGTGMALEAPASAVTVGKTYRVRVRHRDTTGRWSHWSAPAQLVAGSPVSTLVHYWNFNPQVLADALAPTHGTGGSISTTPGATTAFLTDTGQDFQGANAKDPDRDGTPDAAGRHLRVNNPIGSAVVFRLPTTGYKDVSATVETRRSGSGAGTQAWSYTVDGTTFLPLRQVTVPDGTPVVVEFDLRQIDGARDNALFALKVEFSTGTGGAGGNNRFDNFALAGIPLSPAPGGYAAWAATAFTEAELGDPAVSAWDRDADGDGRPNFMEYALCTLPKHGDAPEMALEWSMDGPTRRPGLEFTRPLDATGLTYELMSSDDLVDWTVAATSPVSTVNLATTARVLFRDPESDDKAGRRFLRLRVRYAP